MSLIKAEYLVPLTTVVVFNCLVHVHTHTQVKEIGNFLHSNVLTDLSNQIEQSTEKTMHDFEQSRDDLERHHAKLAQIENEKDQEKRLQKKRE